MFVASLDLGKLADFTALAILECEGTPHEAGIPRQRYSQLAGGYGTVIEKQTYMGSPACFDVVHLERWPLGTTYPAIVEGVGELVRQVSGHCSLVVDSGGVGEPVVDLFRQAGLGPVAFYITAGGEARADMDPWRLYVPKGELVSTIAVGLQTKRLRIAPELALAEVLAQELRDFEVAVTPAANLTYNARTGAHDDLVLAVAMGCWFAEMVYASPVTFTVHNDPYTIGRY